MTLTNKPARSSPVHSSQNKPHEGLEKVVQRHLCIPWQLRPHQPSVAAFQVLQQLLAQFPSTPLVLDSGCGTGESTRAISRAHPDCLVIGIDQSASRLARVGASSFPYRAGNTVWVRAELSTFWWLAVQAGWQLVHHYLLYPNPWPKPSQLRRRWHGHPVFPSLLRLGGRLELRCNWEIYALEFAQAASLVTGKAGPVRPLQEDDIRSPFEIKYRNSGLPLFRYLIEL